MPSSQQYRVIDAISQKSRVSLKELWARRALVLVFAQRDFTARFKQTYVGIAWLLFKPALWLVTLTVVFGMIAKGSPVSSAPYTLIVITGLAPWAFFAAAIADMSNSLIANRHILSKIYFPRLVLPLAALAQPIVDLLAALAVLVGLFLWFQVLPSWRIVAFPFFILMLVSLVTGAGLWLSALNARFRDVGLLLPFLLQIGMYLSPVGYPADQVPDTWQWLYNFNPMVGIIEGIRWSLIDDYSGFHTKALVSTAVIAAVLNITGLRFFGKVEKQLADVL